MSNQSLVLSSTDWINEYESYHTQEGEKNYFNVKEDIDIASRNSNVFDVSVWIKEYKNYHMK